MYEQDPMRENSASQDATRSDVYENPSSGGDTYTAGDSGARGYTNPDGSHGFIYNGGAEDLAFAEIRTRRYRGALIAVSAVLITVLLGTACFFGAYMAARSLMDDDTSADTSGAGEVGTSNGLYISDGPESGAAPVETSVSDRDTGGSAGPIQTGSETLPPVASIEKLPAERKDVDGDGVADIEIGPDGQVLTSAGMDAVSVATVVARVADAVVEITTETITQTGSIGQYVTGGAGSGVIISREGYIVTNHHVIDGANTITVRLTNGREYAARLVGTDEQTDIAVLWIDASEADLTVATLGSSYDLVVGEDIIAIGNPLGSLGGTVTEGMVSATAREITVSGSQMTLLQVSAPINPGNSGGGLFNLAGELVGVVNAKMSSEEIEGLGFAIPVDTAYEIILELIAHGYVRGRPTLGVDVVDVTSPQIAMRYFNSVYEGVYVYDQGHDTLAYGDLILACNGQEIASSAALVSAIRSLRVGDEVTLVIYRNRAEVTITVTLIEEVPTTPVS